MLAGDSALGRALLTFLLHLIVAALLIIGGVGLILAKQFGRVFTICGAAAALLLYVLVLVLAAAGVHFLGLSDADMPVGYTGLLCVPAIATLALAIAPPTARWVTSGWS